MTEVPARCTKFGCKGIEFGFLSSRGELMTRVVSVLQASMTRNANIIVITCNASNEFFLRKNYCTVSIHPNVFERFDGLTSNTRVTSTSKDGCVLFGWLWSLCFD